MHQFLTALTYMKEHVYDKHQLIVTNVHEEPQNAKYGAGRFQLQARTVRFRIAHVTPTKVGQFVAFWQKDAYGNNAPYTEETAPDVLVIMTCTKERRVGTFIFPKSVLVQQGVLRSSKAPGKMALRVYPVWDEPTSKQAIKTQAWQLPYFMEIQDGQVINFEKINELYGI